jgi:hypothetical protein
VIKRIRKIGALIVLLHLGVVLLHGSDHVLLAIEMAAWQTVFIELVIVAAPLVAAVLLWTRLQRAGVYLLAASMAASLIFGLWYHFIAAGADNVFAMPPMPGSAAFKVTAMLLAIIEAAGCLWGLQMLHSQYSASAAGAGRMAA